MKEKNKTIEEMQTEITNLKNRIGQLEQTEKKLKALELEFQSESDFVMKMIHFSPTFFVSLTPEGKTLLMNNTMLKSLKYKSTEVIGKDYINTFISKKDRQRLEQNFKQLKANKKTTMIVADCLTHDRTTITVEWYFNIALSKDKEIDYIFGTGIVQKQPEKQENQINIRFEVLAEQSPNMIFINQNGRIIYANKKCEEIMGYAREEFYAPDFDFLCLIAPESQELIQLNLTRHLMGEEVEPYEYSIITKEGKKLEVLITTKLIEIGREKATLGIITDISAQKKIEKGMRIFLDNALVGVYRSNLTGEILYANKAFSKMFEFNSPQELIAQGALVLYKNPADRELFLTTLKKNGKINYYEMELITRLGKPKNVLVSATLNGTIISGMIMDITERKHMETALRENIEKLEKLMKNTVDSMQRIVETRDPYTAGHQQRVAHLALAIANEMGFSKDQIMGLNLAALIHDIGKICIPAEILARPTKLSQSEFTLIKIHPQTGYEILKKVEFPWPVAKIILQHHERYNGSGYPNGLQGQKIMPEARILAVADVVEAMSSHRPYRPAKTIEQSLEEITKNKGVLYDPEVVEVCVKLFKEKNFTW